MVKAFSDASPYVADRINRSALSAVPFEHCVVDDVLPNEVFEAIHENWPSDEIMVPLPEIGRTTSAKSGQSKRAYMERHVMLLEKRFLEKLPEPRQRFWVDVAHAVMDPPVVHAVYEKFQSALFPRVSHLDSNISLDPEMLVVSDRSNYAIGPHTDSKARFVSMLYYLSPGEQYRSYGTGLYEPKNPDMEINELRHYGFDDFTRHSRVDFVPNRLVAFPRSDRSFHGVEPVPVENCDRRLLIVNIRAPAGAL